MNKCIVLGVDAPISPATQQAIRTIRDLIGPLAPRLILLHVISIPQTTSPALGMYTGQIQATTVTAEQRQEAEKVLDAVRCSLQEQVQNSPHIEICIRLGSPAEEVSRVAKEMHADLVIVGCRGNATSERIRRFFLGSKSHKILQLAPCPVLIVSLQQSKRPAELVAWYEEAITLYLHEHSGSLTIFTVAQVVRLFTPPNEKKLSRRKERAAALLALDHLTSTGVLCRHEVQGELRYVND
jgi:nucleotide-binding universal stress UspA family protein